MTSSAQKIEDKYKAECVAEIETQLGTRFFTQTHQDVRKSGYPDLALHGEGVSTAWEFKHATPRFRSPGVQEWTCRRIAKSSYCRYVIYVEGFVYDGTYDVAFKTCSQTQYVLDSLSKLSDEQQRKIKTTWIVHPNQIHGCGGRLDLVNPEVVFKGFDHEAVVRFMYDVHHERGRLLIHV